MISIDNERDDTKLGDAGIFVRKRQHQMCYFAHLNHHLCKQRWPYDPFDQDFFTFWAIINFIQIIYRHEPLNHSVYVNTYNNSFPLVNVSTSFS